MIGEPVAVDRNALFNDNKGLAYTALYKYMDRYSKRPSDYQAFPFTFDELESYALEGLWLASLRYNPSKQVRFSTYATTAIAYHLLACCQDEGPLIRVGRRVQARGSFPEAIHRALGVRSFTEAEELWLTKPPSVSADRARLQVKIHEMLHFLDPLDRKIIKLRWGYEMPSSEVAKRVSRPHSYVRQRLASVRRMLNHRIKEGVLCLK